VQPIAIFGRLINKTSIMKKLILVVFTLFSVTLFAQKGNFRLDKEYSIGKMGTVDLQSSDAKVFITGSNRNTAHVKIERTVTSRGIVWGDENFSVDVKEENENLIIRENHGGVRVGVIGSYNESYKIEIEVPTGVSLTLDGDDGDYFIKNVNGSILLDIDDGDAEIRNCLGNKFSFRLDDGDIIMDQGQGELDLRADDGDVEIRNAKFTSIHAEMNDGDLIIETSLSSSGNYFLDTEDGTIALNVTSGGGTFDIRHDDGRVVTEGNFKSIERDEDQTRFSLADGSAKVNIRLNDGKAKISAPN
jgi:Putative adhesin